MNNYVAQSMEADSWTCLPSEDADHKFRPWSAEHLRQWMRNIAFTTDPYSEMIRRFRFTVEWQEGLVHRYCICGWGYHKRDNKNYAITCNQTGYTFFACNKCADTVRSIKYKGYVDGPADHEARTINVLHVLQMMKKCANLGAHAAVEELKKFHFEGKKVSEEYNYCVCGKDIKNNFLATCVETGNMFYCGSECIETVCELYTAGKMKRTRECTRCNADMKGQRPAEATLCRRCRGHL